MPRVCWESFSRGSHVTKTRHAHQITAVSLYGLLSHAYSQDCSDDHVDIADVEDVDLMVHLKS